MSRKERDRSRSLVDQAAGPGELGPPLAVLATTFDMAPDFVEADFLPSVMRVTSADSRAFRSRVQLEAALGRTTAVALLCDARCYRGRPASLRVHVAPAIAPRGGYLHAKVSLFVHEDAVRLLVGSANLTVSGYRQNREVAFCITAEKKSPDATRFVRDAIASMRAQLAPWWSDAAEAVVVSAEALLADLPVRDASEDDVFAWSGPAAPLWRRVVDAWPADEPVQSVQIVSPYWSEEEPGQGPLLRLVTAIRERTGATGPIRISLVTPAAPREGGVHLPTLPASFRTLDLAGWNATVEVVAAQPYVGTDDDVQVATGAKQKDGGSIVERRLHAKIVLLEGKSTTLAYAGSANFTSPGWGFGRPQDTHVEAGVILRRRRAARDALRSLIPPLAGKPIALGQAQSPGLATQGPEEASAGPWPEFVREVRLVPTAGETELALVVIVHPELIPASWSIAYDEGGPAARSWSAPAEGPEIEVALTAADLEVVIRRKSVFVKWGDASAWVPVNVALEARAQIPFGDATTRPREDELVAFFQGRISVEDLFPTPEGEDLDGDESTAALDSHSAVDTSKILSYQIRAFVEALPGLREVLLRESSTPTSIRLAVLGPISPLALAKEIHRAAEQGRSPVAAGFQLVELQRALRNLRAEKVPDPVRPAWLETLEEADRRVGTMIAELRAGPAIGAGTTFDRYATAVLLAGGAS